MKTQPCYVFAIQVQVESRDKRLLARCHGALKRALDHAVTRLLKTPEVKADCTLFTQKYTATWPVKLRCRFCGQPYSLGGKPTCGCAIETPFAPKNQTTP